MAEMNPAIVDMLAVIGAASLVCSVGLGILVFMFLRGLPRLPGSRGSRVDSFHISWDDRDGVKWQLTGRPIGAKR